MNQDRVPGWLDDLVRTLRQAESLAARGRAEYDADPALPLAFEALCNRVGDLAKKIVAADLERFAHPIWRQAARTLDFVVHHYNWVDADALWNTVSASFPLLAEQLNQGDEGPADIAQSGGEG